MALAVWVPLTCRVLRASARAARIVCVICAFATLSGTGLSHWVACWSCSLSSRTLRRHAGVWLTFQHSSLDRVSMFSASALHLVSSQGLRVSRNCRCSVLQRQWGRSPLARSAPSSTC